MKYCAYLDIETTGLSFYHEDLTVIGLHLENGSDNNVMQFIGNEICPSKLIAIMDSVDVLYTYNGSRFDLPFIRKKMNVDLRLYCRHNDLMYACWQKNLKGGLKQVERQLGIRRKLTDVDGWIAVQLWNDYKYNGNRNSLKTLLEYNKEDVLNLKKLRRKLKV